MIKNKLIMNNFEVDKLNNKNLRELLSKFSTGVTVITGINEDKYPIGITVNSFTSVSLNPPLVLWCLGKDQPSYKSFINSKNYVINILTKKQLNICNRFANPSIDKFKNFVYDTNNNGIPIITNSLANILCKKWKIYSGGDHDILVGEIIDYNLNENEPLTFYNGKLS